MVANALTIQAVAKRFGVSVRTVVNWINSRDLRAVNLTGSAGLPRGGRS